MLANRIRMSGAGIGEIEYILATDDDFSGTSNGNFRYIGTDEYVEIPHVIKGVNVTRYNDMFNGTSVRGVASTNKNVTNVTYMFRGTTGTSLNLSSFDTSNVTNMSSMFYSSKATSLDLSSFDTSNVTNMSSMLRSTTATSIDLSSFDTSNVTNMSSMFRNATTTAGYARTQAAADKFNSTDYKPAVLTFVVKPQGWSELSG